MPSGFFRSKKGVQEYEQVGKEYDNTVSDNNFVLFEKQTANSPHSKRNKKTVQTMIRLLANDGKEYLVYDANDRRYTPLGAEVDFYLPKQGVYPIPVTRPELKMGENMTTEEVTTGPIIRIDTAYEIPFTKANVDKIHEFADDKNQRTPTQYMIRREGGTKHSVRKYEDFRDGDFEDLEANGRITMTAEERKAKQDAEAKEEQEQEALRGVQSELAAATAEEPDPESKQAKGKRK